jgi:predicted small lipoprotein YifL
MHFSTLWRALACILLSAFLLTACGQKGDLYLPDSQLTQQK